MKIGIDARMLGAGFGIARYVQQLVLHLEKIDSQNQYVLFLRKENWNEFEPTNPNFKKVPADIPWYGWAEQISLPCIIKKEKVDLMHFPHWNVPLFYRAPYIVTIHDLTMFHFPRPEATTRSKIVFWLKDAAHRLVIKNAVSVAKKIIVASEFTREDIHQTLGVTREKMFVTYQAPFEKFSISNSQFSINFQFKNDQNILKKYSISKPYVLYVGAAYPHKNLERLVEAWKILMDKSGNTHQLVLVGKENYFYNVLREKIASSPHPDGAPRNDIVFAGFVPDSELTAIYNSASLYAFPSLYEGFGLPPLEAMAHGIPIASSDRSCLPEILQNAAIYFNPVNPADMAEKIWAALTNQNLREKLLNEAKNLLPKYSWSALSAQTLRIYESVDKSR